MEQAGSARSADQAVKTGNAGIEDAADILPWSQTLSSVDDARFVGSADCAEKKQATQGVLHGKTRLKSEILQIEIL